MVIPGLILYFLLYQDVKVTHLENSSVDVECIYKQQLRQYKSEDELELFIFRKNVLEE